jgi:raffinose/stachyose/melibiose transport system substrate-binding protein
MVRKIIAVLIAILTSLPSYGCAHAGDVMTEDFEALAPSTIVNLRFVNSWGGSDPKSETLQEIFDRFMAENPDIVISNESLYGEDFLQKLKTDFVSGNDPDVFGLWPGSDIKTLVEVGKVADLTGILDGDPAWKESFDPKMWHHTTFGGRIYGLPVEIIFEGLFINADLFEAYDVKKPADYEELKAAVAAFRENGVIPISFNCKAEGTYIYQNMAMMLGGRDAIENPIRDGTVEKCYIEALERLCELYEMGAFPDDLFTMTSVERNNLFRDKKAAMIVQGSWYISALPDDGSVEILPFPEMKEDGDNYTTMVYGLGCGTFYMSRRAWDDPVKREAAIKLLRCLTSREATALLAEKTGMISCVQTPDTVPHSRLAQMGIDHVNKAKSLIGPPDSYLPRTAWENVIVAYLPYVLEGRMTPEELWSRALAYGYDRDAGTGSGD